jgi:DNA-binding MarR family transcriptional regulator
MSDEWNAIGFVISSNYRVTVLRRLNQGPATPSQIANDEDIAITHVSRALRELGERDLVELLVPENRRKGRVYGITDGGATVWETIEAQNLA